MVGIGEPGIVRVVVSGVGGVGGDAAWCGRDDEW